MQERQRRDISRERVAEANRLFRMAYARQLDGDMDRAVVLYEKSIRLHATAEAHTYLGWVKSTRGELDLAIEHCLEAIRLDPEFGNPWNDVGAYLIEQGRAEDSLFYLKRATRLPQSAPRCFPHYNLHRAYLALGDRSRAVEHLRAALDADPEFGPAVEALGELLQPGGRKAPAETELVDPALAGTPVLLIPPRR